MKTFSGRCSRIGTLCLPLILCACDATVHSSAPRVEGIRGRSADLAVISDAGLLAPDPSSAFDTGAMAERVTQERDASLVVSVDDSQALIEGPPERFHVVTESNYAQRVLYSWTTVEQIAELRSERRALVRTAQSTAPGQQPSPFNRWLLAHEAGSSAQAQLARTLLQDPVLRHRRYAWTVPYATSLGLGPRSYGTALVRLQLRADAWWVKLDPASVGAEFSAVDAQQHPVPLMALFASPQRIAGIYHVRDRDAGRVPYREYILCNEAMIERWSVGTREIADEVAAETQLLSTLARNHSPQQRWSIRPWRALGPDPGELEQYIATLAFDTPAYHWEPRALARMIGALALYDPTPPELVVTDNSLQIQRPIVSTQADSGL